MRQLRQLLFVALVVLIAIAMGRPFTPAQAIVYPSPPVYGITCTGITQSNGAASVQWDRNTSGTGTENLRYLVTDGAGTELFIYDDIRSVGSAAIPTAFGYFTLPSYNPIRLLLTSPAGNGFPEQVLFDITGECEGLPWVEVDVEEEAPGCDVLMNITTTAVSGAFVADSPTYWKPGERADAVISAGNTAWVLGVDSSGQYYKIIWVCDYLWVPVSSMGPNYDDVWNGTPLPIEVVE